MAKNQTRVLFTADTHFGHRSQALRRGFDTVAEHDRTLIENWNSVVSPGDTIYVVGDFAAYCPTGYGQGVLDRLRGRKVLILGNHDKIGRQLKGWAEPPEHRKFLSLDEVEIVLDHYAGKTWVKSARGSIQLYGHSHGRMPGTSQSLDVGVDCWTLFPVALPEIRARLATLPPLHEPASEAEDDDEVPGGTLPR